MAFAVLSVNTTLSATMEDLWTDPAGTHSFSFSSGAEETFRVIDDDAVFNDNDPFDNNQVVAPQSTIFTDNAKVASRQRFDVTPDNGDPSFTVYVVFENTTSNDDYTPINMLDYALVSDTPMIAGVNYSISNQNSNGNVNYSNFSDLVVCYALGTLIETPDGPRPVETLRSGDLVMTADHGPQPIRWSHSHDHPLDAVDDESKPVLIKAGALGHNLPTDDLIVSPQHRLLVGGGGQLQEIFASEALAPAKSLTSLPRIRHMQGKTRITWIHFACDRHEIVTANGCLSESLLLGPVVMNGLEDTDRKALQILFGMATAHKAALNGPPARDCLSVCSARSEIAEHFKRAYQPMAWKNRKSAQSRPAAMRRYA
ncbi:Hint domain-containing protein [Pseudooceanicola sp.]|uniref:Hint domain-containing protein n=1 Tax=Pseudooceanicola sp. TaxID=1914328 RepID=UPI00260A4836|nr:Hint domain-containing protein [Pseudooceanicola sp.]MDF1855849.1 Hint domain-containing protein [Pseudooceanicola sp.]